MRVGAGTLAKNARPIALKAIRRGIYPGICLVNFHFDLDFLANRRRDGEPTTIASLTSFRDIATEREKQIRKLKGSIARYVPDVFLHLKHIPSYEEIMPVGWQETDFLKVQVFFHIFPFLLHFLYFFFPPLLAASSFFLCYRYHSKR